MMTKAYSLAFKQKMVERATGRNAVSPSDLCREIGIRQQNLSRWLHEARSLPSVACNTPKARVWTVEQKAQALAGSSKFSGEQLTSYLERQGITLADSGGAQQRASLPRSLTVNELIPDEYATQN